jgi:hypothetical protein
MSTHLSAFQQAYDSALACVPMLRKMFEDDSVPGYVKSMHTMRVLDMLQQAINLATHCAPDECTVALFWMIDAISAVHNMQQKSINIQSKYDVYVQKQIKV